MRLLTLFICFWGVVLLGIGAPEAYAGYTGLVQCGGVDCNYCTFIASLTNVLNWLRIIAASIAAMVIMYGGFQMVFSGGNQAGYQEGKKYLTNAVVGLIVLMIAFTLVDVLIQALVKDENQAVRVHLWSPVPANCGTMRNQTVNNDVAPIDLEEENPINPFEDIAAGDSFNRTAHSAEEWNQIRSSCEANHLVFREVTTSTGVVGTCQDPNTPVDPLPSLNCPPQSNSCSCTFGSEGSTPCVTACQNLSVPTTYTVNGSVLTCNLVNPGGDECDMSTPVCVQTGLPLTFEACDENPDPNNPLYTCYYRFQSDTNPTDPTDPNPTDPTDPSLVGQSWTEYCQLSCDDEVARCGTEGGMPEILTSGLDRVSCVISSVDTIQ